MCVCVEGKCLENDPVLVKRTPGRYDLRSRNEPLVAAAAIAAWLLGGLSCSGHVVVVVARFGHADVNDKRHALGVGVRHCRRWHFVTIFFFFFERVRSGKEFHFG